jgi:hypothetical protein
MDNAPFLLLLLLQVMAASAQVAALGCLCYLVQPAYSRRLLQLNLRICKYLFCGTLVLAIILFLVSIPTWGHMSLYILAYLPATAVGWVLIVMCLLLFFTNAKEWPLGSSAIWIALFVLFNAHIGPKQGNGFFGLPFYMLTNPYGDKPPYPWPIVTATVYTVILLLLQFWLEQKKQPAP